MNKKRLYLTKNIQLKDTIICTHLASSKYLREQTLKLLKDVGDAVRSIRILGSLALDLCQIADRKGVIIANNSCNIWDIAAGSLILREAGGEIRDWLGQEIVYDLDNPQKKYQILAGDLQLINELVVRF